MAESARLRYLVLRGTLYPDNRFVLRSSHVTDDGNAYRGEAQSRVVAELVDEQGSTLVRHGVPIVHPCDGAGPADSATVRGAVPFHPGTRLVRLTRDGLLIHELVVSRREPEVRLTWRPSGLVRGRQEISWEATHPEAKPLEFSLRYSDTDGATWRHVGWRTRESQTVVDFDELPGGDHCHLAVVASDGVRDAMSETARFRVPVKPCQAVILGPANGAVCQQGQPLRLRGQGVYLEDTAPELRDLSWASDRDGLLGRGAVLEVVALSPGDHRIELTAGAGDRAGRSAIRVTVVPTAATQRS